jgi:uncharacterized SAM-binding protein YcdF (DUF218 family)
VLFVLKKILTQLLLPPASILLLALLGALVLRRSRRTGRALLAAALVLLFVCSTPVLPDLLERSLAVSGPVDLALARSAQAIVVLTSGREKHAPEFGGESISRHSLERARYGARLAKLTGLPLLVSGGTVFDGTPEAELMRAVLENEFAVPVRWTDTRSRDTHDNAIESQRILAANGVRRIVLVTHSVHMRRAVAEFRTTGLDVIAAPTKLPREHVGNLLGWIPNGDDLVRSRDAIYEVLALVARSLGLD